MKVLDHGHVELVGHMGGDLSVVNGARVSFGKQVDAVDEADMKLINYLMRERHGSPFEHNAFTFNVKCPIFLAREWMRHRIGSFNEISGRYAELHNEFYVPEPQDVRQRVGKPGNYQYEPAGDYATSWFRHIVWKSGQGDYMYYQDALDKGIAPELARLVLPVNTYTQFVWTINARSLMNFLSLRTAENAQWEIRQYAQSVEWYFKQSMPCTYETWVENGRVAP